MPELKAAMILPMLYLAKDHGLWHELSRMVAKMGYGPSVSTFRATRLVIDIYDLYRTELRSES